MTKPRRAATKLDLTTGVFLFTALGAGAALWFLHGSAQLLAAAGAGLALLIVVMPIVVMAVMLGAYVQALLPAERIRRWVGRDSGLRGLTLATIAGALTPGGPFAAFPLVVALYRAGGSLPVCITYLTAWGVLGVQRALVWELPFFGFDFVALRLLVSLPLPLLAGYAADWLFAEERRF